MSGFSARRVGLLASSLMVLLVLPVSASPKRSAVIGEWRGAPSSVAVGTDLDVVLHLIAIADAPVVIAEALPSRGLQLLTTVTRWAGTLRSGQTVDLPMTVRVVADGDWTIGARITIYRPGGNQVAGAVLNVVAANGVATIARDSRDLIRMATLSTLDDARAMGIAMPDRGTPQPDLSGPAVASTISGTILYRDPEGFTHPVRGALLDLHSGTGPLLARTSTNETGAYSATVNADSVRVVAYTQDPDDTRVVVSPPGSPTLRYFVESAVTPITAATTTIDITSAATVRGAPNAPSTDSIHARAFAVYDAMLTYWVHASALIGRSMNKTETIFPSPSGAPCVTCYNPISRQIYIHREDAFDWDILGHEFFHFVVHRASSRLIDTSEGGDHNGGSAIGQNDGTGHLRTRDEGMRLAWSEGLATAMSLLIQKSPPGALPFPRMLNVGDSFYQETENVEFADDAERPPSPQGFGAEDSVIGLLWDLSDTAQDTNGIITDTLAGVDSRLLWNSVNAVVPCNPCDRVDKFWAGITTLFGLSSATTLDVAKIFALNDIGPRATGPANGASVPGTAAPTFTWIRAGDPAPAHSTDHFYLAFSRDNFQSHRVVIPVPTLGATEYTPTDAEWASVQAGGSGGQTYKWFLAGNRSDAPSVPAGWFWYSNVNSLVPRSIEATIAWAPIGADVDFHLANPTGTDIAYYNTNTGWGFLDRDCITTCAQEIISITSLPLPGPYRLYTHYYSDHGQGPATVHAVVRSGSQVLLDQTFVLSAAGETRTLVSLALDGTQTTATDHGNSDDAAPANLPPKGRRR